MTRKSSTQMALEAKQGTTVNKGKERWNGAKFVQFELDVQLQKRCKEWAFSEEDAWDTLYKWTDGGYKCTFKWDGYSKSFAVFISTETQTDPNFGYILTGRGSSPYKAFKQAVFKHSVCFNGDAWSAFAERPSADDIDD